jgi:hypothetical protein
LPSRFVFPRFDAQAVPARGAAMQPVFNDNAKLRLTERDDILTAINILRLRGYDSDELVTEITKIFYVDLDTYNEVVKAA